MKSSVASLADRHGWHPWFYFAFDDQGWLIEGNDTISQLVGIPIQDIPGRQVHSLLTKAGQVFYQTHLFPLLRLKGQVNEIFLLLKIAAGGSMPVLAYGLRCQHEGQWVNLCYCAPIPQRRSFEQELIRARKEAEETLNENVALNQAKRELEDHQAALDRRIRQLENANDELRQIAKIVSHDLQEPIRKIAILSNFARSNPDSQLPANHPLLQQIDDICRATSQLISGLRDYILLDTQKIVFEPVGMEELIRKAAHKASKLNDFAVDWLLTSSIPDSTGNQEQLLLLFVHVFDNAIRFRQPDQDLRVQVLADIIKENKFVAIDNKYHYVDHIRIRIRDNGTGFAARYRHDVFLLLKRLNRSAQTLGMGLAFCRKIVGNHYGTISAESSPGQGTTITIILPLQP